MSISEERSRRYTFEPDQLTPVTNPEELKRIHEKTGMRPLPDDEQAWNITINDLLEYARFAMLTLPYLSSSSKNGNVN